MARIKEKILSARKNDLRDKRKRLAEEYCKEKEAKNKITHEQLYELHEKLVQTCLNFINEHNIGDVEEVVFNADSLQISAQHGEWQPCTDSSLIAYEEVPNDNYFMVRKEIDYSM